MKLGGFSTFISMFLQPRSRQEKPGKVVSFQKYNLASLEVVSVNYTESDLWDLIPQIVYIFSSVVKKHII